MLDIFIYKVFIRIHIRIRVHTVHIHSVDKHDNWCCVWQFETDLKTSYHFCSCCCCLLLKYRNLQDNTTHEYHGQQSREVYYQCVCI